jgi:hypothetical protein
MARVRYAPIATKFRGAGNVVMCQLLRRQRQQMFDCFLPTDDAPRALSGMIRDSSRTIAIRALIASGGQEMCAPPGLQILVFAPNRLKARMRRTNVRLSTDHSCASA